MKLCVSTYSLARWRREQNKTLEQSLDWLASIGVEAVELVGLDAKPEADPIRRARTLRRRCERLGLAVAGYCVGAELLVPEKEQAQVVDRLKREVEVAAELGAPTMRHDVTRGPQSQKLQMSFPQVLKRVVPAIRAVADHAQTLGVVSSLENHGFYLQTADRVQGLIDAVDHPHFRLTLDLGNFLVLNQDPVAAVRQLAGYAVMVHAKDFHIRPKKSVPPAAPAHNGDAALPAGWIITPTPIAIRGAIVGHGEVDLATQLKLLKRARYRGYLSLEFEGLEDPQRAIRLGLATLRERLA